MNNFEQLKKNWREQPLQEPSETNFSQVKSGIKNVAKKQKMTNFILSATVGVLIAFFFYIGAMDHKDVALAIGAMIVALVIRVVVEVFSVAHLKNLSTTSNIQYFKGKLENYYKRRILVHLILTPILFLVYCYAFWTLLPDFKISLSQGFYNYILISSVVILVSLGGLIFVQVKKELRFLRALNEGWN